jgi:hypothetical protein
MTTTIRTAGLALAAATLLAGASQAIAQPAAYDGYGNPPVVVGAPPPLQGRPLTVAPRHRYNPYHNGVATVVTGPVQVAGDLAALPFRVINGVFPPDPRSPLAVVGAPAYAAGKVVEFPFHVIQAPFGDPTIYGE